MLGNAQGWIIAGVVLLTEITAVVYALSLDATSPPTSIATAINAMDPIILPVDPRSIVSTAQTGDAGELYRKAAAGYLANVSLYEDFIRDRDRSLMPKLTAIEVLTAATHLHDGAIFVREPAEVVVYGESAVVQALGQVGKGAIDAGLLVERRDPARAKQLYEAAFALGIRLFDERLTYREIAAGVELMSTAGACLADQARRAHRDADAASIIHFNDTERDYVKTRLLPTIEAIATQSESKIGDHNGDVFAFARDSKERMWRVEAILKLGRMKFNVGNPGSPGDQRQAARLATRYADADDDPVIRRAATLARDLTIEQFRTLR